jgi:hypothetical protein
MVCFVTADTDDIYLVYLPCRGDATIKITQGHYQGDQGIEYKDLDSLALYYKQELQASSAEN